MVKRKQYDQAYKEQLVAEMLAGTSVAKIAQRENIAPHTLYKWKEKIGSGDFKDSHREEIELRRRISEFIAKSSTMRCHGATIRILSCND